MNALVFAGERRRILSDIALDRPAGPTDLGAAQRKQARREHAVRYVHAFPRAPVMRGSGQLNPRAPITDTFAVGASDPHCDDAPATPPAGVTVRVARAGAGADGA